MRKMTALITAAVTATGLAAAGLAFGGPALADLNCADTMVFEVGGHLDKDANVYNDGNAALPSGVSFTKIHYSASIAPWPGETIFMDDSVNEGIAKLNQAVHDFHGSCSDSHILIAGYSEGAIVSGDELNNLSRDQSIPHNQISGVLYGDPRRTGVNGAPGGIETNIPTVLPKTSMRGARGFGDLAVHEICNRNDGICYSDNPFTNGAAFANGVDGYLNGDHNYNWRPFEQQGNGDTVIAQQPKIPYGPPLPLPIPTPYDMFNGNPAGAQQAVAQIKKQVLPLLPPQLRDKLSQFPFLGA